MTNPQKNMLDILAEKSLDKGLNYNLIGYYNSIEELQTLLKQEYPYPPTGIELKDLAIELDIERYLDVDSNNIEKFRAIKNKLYTVVTDINVWNLFKQIIWDTDKKNFLFAFSKSDNTSINTQIDAAIDLESKTIGDFDTNTHIYTAKKPINDKDISLLSAIARYFYNDPEHPDKDHAKVDMSTAITRILGPYGRIDIGYSYTTEYDIQDDLKHVYYLNDTERESIKESLLKFYNTINKAKKSLTDTRQDIFVDALLDQLSYDMGEAMVYIDKLETYRYDPSAYVKQLDSYNADTLITTAKKEYNNIKQSLDKYSTEEFYERSQDWVEVLYQ